MSTPYQFFCACEGYYDKVEDMAAIARNLAAITHRSMGGKSDIGSIWTLHNDPKQEIMKPWTKEEFEECQRRGQNVFTQMKNK